MISPVIGFDAGATVDLVFTSSQEYYQNSSAVILDLKLGLTAVF